MARPRSKETLAESILKRFRARGRGAALTPSAFLDLASRPEVAVALTRLINRGALTRVSRGVYCYPKKNDLLGELAPRPEEVAQAIANRAAARIMPTGAQAANLLGLTEQVPARIIYLTDGPSQTLQVRNLPVELRQASTKRLALAGRVSGTVAEALRFLRQSQIDNQIVAKLRDRLSRQEKQQLMKDVAKVPDWIGNIFRAIAQDTPQDGTE